MVTKAPAAERLAVAALALVTFGMALNANVLAALAPFLDDALGLDSKDIGWLLAAAGYAGAAGALLLGPAVDRVGRRPPLLWGAVLFCVASGGYLFASTFPELLVVRMLTGFAAGVVLTSASAAIADLVPYARRGAAMGMLTAGIFLAVPVGMPLAVVFAQAGSWRAIFAVQVVAALIAVALLARSLPAELGRGGRAPSQWTVLKQPMVTPALLSVLCYTGAFFTSVQFVGQWLDRSALLPRDQQAWLWIVLGLTSALGSAALGRISDRCGKRRYVLWTTAAVAVGLWGLSGVVSVTSLVAVGLPVALLSGSRSAALLALISSIVEPRLRGTLLGIRSAAVNLGMAGFAGLGGEVYSAYGYPVLLSGAAVALVVSWALIVAFVGEGRER